MFADRQGIADAFVALADTLTQDFDVVDFSQRLCMYGAALPDMGAAGVMLRDDNELLRVLAASSEEVETLEMLEIQRAAGPCYESFRSGELVTAPTRHELTSRWPQIGPRVAEHYASVYAFPLRWRGSMLGSLGMYGREPNALAAGDVAVGQALADISSISLLQSAQLEEANVRSKQLQGALDSRVIIEQAKGKYAERHGVGMGAAFDALRRYAQSHNAKLVAVATAFVADDLDF